MRYSLWSHGRLIGHTALDIHTVTPSMRQGFIEPAPEGASVLADATGVWRALAEVKRNERARGSARPDDHLLVSAATQRREALDLELRDESGARYECDFMRITDLFDMNAGIVDEMTDTEEEEEAKFQIALSALSGEAREEALARRAEMNAEVEAMLREIESDDEERDRLGSSPPPVPEDPRWDTMQYMVQVHLEPAAWDDPD